MRQELPPLNAIPAFEAAARHLNFSRAAEELFVTHGAVSRQVKNLEDFLGQNLFRRQPRALELTEAGIYYLRVAQDVLAKLHEGSDYLKSERDNKPITISVIPSFAVRWLVPRLERLYRLHPGIEVLLNASFDMVNFDTEDIDIAVRLGRGSWPGLQADLLMTIDTTPVCSPTLMEGDHPLTMPDRLRHHTLLHDTTRDGWRAWLSMAGVKEIDANKGSLFNDHNVLLQAAIDGLGVALARKRLVRDDIQRGRLVMPFPLSLPSEVAYYLVYPKERAGTPKFETFRRWLLTEASEDH